LSVFRDFFALEIPRAVPIKETATRQNEPEDGKTGSTHAVNPIIQLI
jgi:hypothetical protein